MRLPRVEVQEWSLVFKVPLSLIGLIRNPHSQCPAIPGIQNFKGRAQTHSSRRGELSAPIARVIWPAAHSIQGTHPLSANRSWPVPVSLTVQPGHSSRVEDSRFDFSPINVKHSRSHARQSSSFPKHFHPNNQQPPNIPDDNL